MIKYSVVLISAFLLTLSVNVFSEPEKEDVRSVIAVTEVEREAVLAEMRTFLENLQKITEGISSGDMAIVAEYATKSGRSVSAGMPKTLHQKLPMEFKKLGFDTHTRFDQLALDAESLGDKEHTLRQVSDLMKNCVSCHAMYRFDVIEKQ